MSKIKKGFSLVELSIVILIIGLLIAGVSSGTKLLKQAELRSIITDMETLTVAYHTFIATYDAKPGDMSDASVFFTGCATTPAFCNGDGNGTIEWINNNGGALTDEVVLGMRHMNLAGVISNGGSTVIPDGYTTRDNNYETSNGYFYKGSLNNGYGFVQGQVWFIAVGTFFPIAETTLVMAKDGIEITGGQFYLKGAIAPITAFQIDKKIDDGATAGGTANGANTGKFRTQTGGNGDVCVAGNVYTVTSTAIGCVTGKSI